MNKIIENERLRIEVAERGSELVSIYDKLNDREVLWVADPAVWPKHAPLLFPMIGACYNRVYHYNGAEYPIMSHGFAWTSQFVFAEEEGKIKAVLTSSEESKKIYPFDYELTTGFSLSGNQIIVSWEVKNTGEGELLYSIGGHPGFLMPEGKKSSDMYLQFPGKQELLYYFIHEDSKCALKDDVKTMPLDADSCIKVTENFWDNDAYVFDGQKLDVVSICHEDKTPYVTMRSEGFPYFGIWTKPGAPYICLEPWQGRCDVHGFTGELKDKDGIHTLKAGMSESFSYIIEIA